jgi:hypothetical protein
MASRRNDTKKPESDYIHVTKCRNCLVCSKEFTSTHNGHRVCPNCKKITTWRSGVVAA